MAIWPARPRLVVVAAAVTGMVIVLGVGLAVFEPWKLVVDDVVDEAIPEAAPATTASGPAPSAVPAPTPSSSAPSPVLLAQGTFVSHEHATSGTAEVIQRPDGSRLLALRSLNTSNGPDLRVWLTDARVIEGRDGWHVFDDGRHVELGPLKGNIGDQTYDIPADANLTGLGSVSVWCDRFNVSFGAAALLGL